MKHGGLTLVLPAAKLANGDSIIKAVERSLTIVSTVVVTWIE